MGDTNANRVVNTAGLSAVPSQFGQAGAPGSPAGGVNDEGLPNISDLNIVSSGCDAACRRACASASRGILGGEKPIGEMAANPWNRAARGGTLAGSAPPRLFRRNQPCAAIDSCPPVARPLLCLP